jgi:hypothetical protein
MSSISLILFVAGAALLIFGFKRTNRMLLVTAAFLWLASGTWGDFSRGFKAGLKDGLSNGASATSSIRVG